MMSIFIAITTVLLAMQNIVQKAFNTCKAEKKISNYGFNIILSIAAIILFLFAPKTNKPLQADIFIYATGFAAAYFACVYYQLKAVGEGALSVTSLIMSYSLILPTIYGVVFLNEKLSLLKYIGIALLMVSLYLVAGKSTGEPLTKKWFVFVIIAFIGNGLCTIIQKLYIMESGGLFKTEFMIISLIIVAIAFMMLALIKDKKVPIPKPKNGSIFAVLFGLFNAVVNILVMKMASYPAAIVFPTISAGSIVITFFVSKFIYREKHTVIQLIGFSVGTASVVLLNM